MNRSILRQRLLRSVQSTTLVGVIVFMAARAVSVLFGPIAGWMAALLSVVAVWMQIGAGRGFVPPGARPVSKYEAPEIVNALRELSLRAGLEGVPLLYYLDRPEAIAFTTGTGRAASIIVSRGLLRSLPFREVVAVMAHEIAHIQNHDLTLFALVEAMRRLTRTVASILAAIVVIALPLMVFGLVALPPNTILYVAVIPLVSLLAQLSLLRTREFRADIGAVELTGDPEALARALERLDAVGPGWGRTDRMAELFRTHPATSERVARLLDLAPEQKRFHWISV